MHLLAVGLNKPFTYRGQELYLLNEVNLNCHERLDGAHLVLESLDFLVDSSLS